MTSKIFISYSHSEDKAVEKLHKHFSMLRRENLISTWFDNAILPGDKLEEKIEKELNQCDIFISLLSPDYLASNYCYEKEFSLALELFEKGSIRIVPIIIEPCDWLSSPFRKFMAIPKDGKPVSEWTNINNAYLDIVSSLRRIVESEHLSILKLSSSEEQIESNVPIRKLKIKKEFDSIQKAEFADESFHVLKEYFSSSTSELSQVSSDLRSKYEDMSSTSFTCSLVNRALGKESHITVNNSKGKRYFGDISYCFERYAEGNSSNGAIRVDADEYALYLIVDSFPGSSRPKLNAKQAAEWLWNIFVAKAGVEYE